MRKVNTNKKKEGVTISARGSTTFCGDPVQRKVMWRIC